MIKACEVCHRSFTTSHRQQRYCSKSCAQSTRTNLGEIGRIGGKISAKKTRQRRERLWAERYPGLPVEIARKIRMDGYTAGWNRGNRVGYAQGWEACAKALRVRVA